MAIINQKYNALFIKTNMSSASMFNHSS